MSDLGRGGGIVNEHEDAFAVQDRSEKCGPLVERVRDPIGRYVQRTQEQVERLLRHQHRPRAVPMHVDVERAIGKTAAYAVCPMQRQCGLADTGRSRDGGHDCGRPVLTLGAGFEEGVKPTDVNAAIDERARSQRELTRWRQRAAGIREIDVAMNRSCLHDGVSLAGEVVGGAWLISHCVPCNSRAWRTSSSARSIVGVVDRTRPNGFECVDTDLRNAGIFRYLMAKICAVTGKVSKTNNLIVEHPEVVGREEEI